MSDLLARIVATLAELSLGGAAVILTAAILDPVLRRAPWPELRAVPWLLVLARFALPPGFASPIALLGGILPGSASHEVIAGAGVPAAALAASGAAGILDAALLDAILVALWLAGMLFLALGAARRHRTERARILARALPEPPERWIAAASSAQARLGLRRLPRLAVVPGIPGAMVLGALRPVVVLPERFPGETAARREHVMLHELVHLRRGDPLLGALSAALQVVFWFHPLLWWARRRLALAVELCADDEVARALGAAAPDYRSTLLSFAGHGSGAVPAGALGFLARRAAILERLRALERPRGGSRGPRRLAVGLLALSLAATVLPMRSGAVPSDPHPATGAEGVSSAALVPSRIIPDRPGCLLDRYAILGELAAAEGPPAASPNHHASSRAR